MKKITTLLFSLLVIFTLSACSLTAATPATTGTLSADGSGIVKITPDIAYINIGVQSKSENVKAALDENNTLAAAISSTLEALGVAEVDIQTSSFNVYPMQDYGVDGMGYETADGTMMPKTYYQVDNIVMVTVRDLTNLGQILDNTVQAGANSINSINFDVQNKDTALAEARKLAIEDAQTKAQAIAEDAGISLGKIINISVYSSGTTPYYDAKGGTTAYASDVPISAGQLNLTMTANITYEIK